MRTDDIQPALFETRQFHKATSAAPILKPDFFILGAPKCGTTSLAAWLGGHPQVFISPIKEPHFFNTDDRQGIATLDAYEALFRRAAPHHRAIGEASVWYLSSTQAVANILRYQPAARFVVMLRNPLEMAPALHAEMLLSGHENVRHFRTAWDLQHARREGRALPPLSWARRRLLYGEVCALGVQLQRLLQMVPAHRVFPIVLDDMIADPRREYLRLLTFLRLNDDGRAVFPVYNQARALRWPSLARAMFVAGQLKRRAGITRSLKLWEWLSAINRAEGPRAPLPPETAALLRRHFSDDVTLLGRQLGRDLRHWLIEAQAPRGGGASQSY
jgi:hypothetical protein